MRISTLSIALCLTIFLNCPLQAGFLDRLIDKTADKIEQAVERKVDKKIDESIDGTLEGGQQEQSPAPPQPEQPVQKPVAQDASQAASESASSNASAAKPESGEVARPTTRKAMALAIVKVAPEILNHRTDYYVKGLLLEIFPEEQEINSNEFYWHKNKEALIEKAIELSKDAPTTFEVAPWIDNSSNSEYGYNPVNYFNPRFGQYDFEKRAFPVYPETLEIPWISAGNKSKVAAYQFVGIKPRPEENHWVEMDVEDAEKLTEAQGGMFKLYGKFKFTITEAVGIDDLTEHPQYAQYEKYIKMKGDAVADELVPYFNIVLEDNIVDLYLPKEKSFKQNMVIPRNKLDYFTTISFDAN